MPAPSTFVLGLGNVLMGDDGFGPAVIHAFEAEYDVDADVEVVDIGTPGLDLTPWLTDAARVIFVDTVRADAPPGTIRLYSKADLLRHAPSARVSPHDPGVKETLLALDFAGRGPAEVTLIGVVPATTALGLDLSNPVREAIPPAIDAIVLALRRAGLYVARRASTCSAHPASVAR